MRRTPHPLMSEAQMPLLSQDDLTIDIVPLEILTALGGCDFMADDTYVQRYSALHKCHTTLCILLTEILFALYNAGDSPDRSTGRASRLKPSSPSAQTIEKFDVKAKDWLDKIPDWLAGDLSGVLSDSDQHINTTFSVHVAYVRAFYYLSIVTLHRIHAQVQNFPKTQGESLDCIALSRYRADIAADSIAKMIPLLRDRGLTKFLPLSGVTAILQAAMYSLQRSCTEDHFSQMLSVNHVESFARALITLSDVHLAANYSLSLLNYSLQRSEFDWCRQYLEFIPTYLQSIEAPPFLVTTSPMATTVPINPQG